MALHILLTGMFDGLSYWAASEYTVSKPSLSSVVFFNGLIQEEYKKVYQKF